MTVTGPHLDTGNIFSYVNFSEKYKDGGDLKHYIYCYLFNFPFKLFFSCLLVPHVSPLLPSAVPPALMYSCDRNEH
jgi:hypothetical protein